MDDITDEQSKLIQAIINACEKLNWAVALPTDNTDDQVDGMIIGTEEYIAALIGGSDDHEDFFEEFDEMDAETNVELPSNKKKITH